MYLDKIELQFEKLKHRGFKKKFLIMNVLAASPLASSKEEGSKIA